MRGTVEADICATDSLLYSYTSEYDDEEPGAPGATGLPGAPGTSIDGDKADCIHIEQPVIDDALIC